MRHFFGGCLAALLAGISAGGESPTAERIARLADPDFEVREKALRELLDDPKADAPLIRKAWEAEKDLEVRTLLGKVLADRLRPALKVEILFRQEGVDAILLGRAVLTAPAGYPDPAALEEPAPVCAIGWPAQGDCFLPPDSRRKKGQRLTIVERFMIREQEAPPLEGFSLRLEDAPGGRGAVLRVEGPPFQGTLDVPPPDAETVWFARGRTLFRIERVHPEAALSIPPLCLRYQAWKDRTDALRDEARRAAAELRIDGLQEGDLAWILDGAGAKPPETFPSK